MRALGGGGQSSSTADADHIHEESIKKASEGHILCANFNQDGSCLALGGSAGYSVVSTSNADVLRSEVQNGGFSVVQMLFCSNIVGMSSAIPVGDLACLRSRG